MIVSLFRIVLVTTSIAISGLGGVAFAQGEIKATEQQSKTTLEPLLGQIASKTCPELAQNDIGKASEDINASKRKIPEEIQLLLEAWLDYSKYYKQMHYVISIAIIVFGALAAGLSVDGWWGILKTLAAIMATISAGVNTTLTPNVDYKKFDEAFVVLNTAKAAYMTNPFVTLCDVGKAVASGELIIHKGE